MAEQKETTPDKLPDTFGDLFNIYDNPLQVMLVRHKSLPPEKQGDKMVQRAQTVSIERFTPEEFKLICMIGRKQMKAREATNGKPLHIPEELLKGLNLTEADW